MEETLKDRSSLAAPLVFLLVFALHLIPKFIGLLKKRGSLSPEEITLRAEIKQLLKEASALSQPSTFAQAAKLRRMATAKEKELQKSQEMQNKKIFSHDKYLKAVTALKGITYLALLFWFWGVPLATLSPQLLQPMGKQLSWSAGRPVNGSAVVGIIPWLALSARSCILIISQGCVLMGTHLRALMSKLVPDLSCYAPL
ncbi:protein GET1 [Macadamia integrifolia]|uniref:protein GET1 n=1 Tax=Macadamia integrifolia TaxID=60698 RepID=UPI001C4F2BBD|nr:protein GET1 [Macadamia integrifolia]